MMQWMSGGGGWGMGLTWLFWLGLLAAAVFVVMGLTQTTARRAGRGESAQEILDRRFARGEIDREEYEASRELIRQSGSYRPGHRSI